jgi:hypothetical protein
MAHLVIPEPVQLQRLLAEAGNAQARHIHHQHQSMPISGKDDAH